MGEIIITSENLENDLRYIVAENPEHIVFRACDFENGLPKELFSCTNLKILVIDSCNYRNVEYGLLKFKLTEIHLPNNGLENFPYNLLRIDTLKLINLDNNFIEDLDQKENYKNILISLSNQYINKIPRTGYYPNVRALSANIGDIIYENKDDYILGPDDNWLSDNAEILNECCQLAIMYTHRGDKLINGSLRNGILPAELKEFYNNLLAAKENNIPIPIGSLLFRGINIENFTVDSTFTDKGFSSYSFSQHVARRFSKHIIILPINREIKGISLDSRFGTSRYDEKEILLGPNLKIVCKGISEFEEYKYYICEYVSEDPPDFTMESPLYNRFSNLIEIVKSTSEIIIVDKFLLFPPEDMGMKLLTEMIEFVKTGINYITVEKADGDTFYFLLLNLISVKSPEDASFVKCNYNELKTYEIIPYVMLLTVEGLYGVENIKLLDLVDYIKTKNFISWTDKNKTVHPVTYYNFDIDDNNALYYLNLFTQKFLPAS